MDPYLAYYAADYPTGGAAVSKESGLGDRFLLGGWNLSGDTAAIDNCHGGPAAQDVTGIDKSAMERIGGLKDASMEWTSWFNPANAHTALSTLPTTSRVTTYLRGLGIGSPGAGLVGKQINYDPKRAADGTLQLAVSVQGSDGSPLEWGVQLTDGLRTDTTATNGASVDNAASSAFGAAFYLHALSVTGTSVVVKVQSSTDNSAWSDLATFATVPTASAPTAERVAVTGTVPRYLRVVTTGTFNPATFVVLGCRYGAAA